MLHYDSPRGLGAIKLLFALRGSCFPRSARVVSIPTLLSIFCTYMLQDEDRAAYIPRIKHPFAPQIFAVILGFAIVFRTNMALGRYWEGVTNIEQMLGKWMDSFTQLSNYANVTRVWATVESDTELIARVDLFRQTLAHWFSMMSALAVCQLRSEDLHAKIPTISARSFDFEFSLPQTLEETPEGIFYRKPEPPCKNTSTRLRRTYGKKTSPATTPKKVNSKTSIGSDSNMNFEDECEDASNSVYVLGRILLEEAKALDDALDKVTIVAGWVTMLVTEFSNRGWIRCPAPVLSRAYQETSHGILAYHQACKVTLVPFPFPFTQMLQLLLILFLFICPITVSQYSSGYFSTSILTFIVTMGYWGLNEICAELENPYGEDINDLPLENMHTDFIERIQAMLRKRPRRMDPFAELTETFFNLPAPPDGDEIKRAGTDTLSEKLEA